MRPADEALAARLADALVSFEQAVLPLPGIDDPAARDALILRLIESDRRVRFLEHLASAASSMRRLDPADELFDPLRAAVAHGRAGDFDEACWMIFWFVHFGRHRTSRYQLAREVYGRRGQGQPWTWTAVRADPAAFATWLTLNAAAVRAAGAKFGNHRKYERLERTGDVVASYVEWVGPAHALKFAAVVPPASTPEEAFDHLYRSMSGVRQFGRVARFDYFATLARLGLTTARPGRSYFTSSTGPLAGARLLLGQGTTVSAAEDLVIALDRDYLHLGSDVLEDALCNWQKDPMTFKPFRG